MGFPFHIYRKQRGNREEGRRIYALHRGDRAIVFFHHLSAESSGGSAGNHIDYMHDGEVMNDRMGFSARNEPNLTEAYFIDCADVWVATLPRG